MKTIIIFFLSMILSGITFGQIEEQREPYSNVDEVKVVPPKFIGVKNAVQLQKDGKFASIDDYLAKNIEYPEKDAKNFKQGTEVVQFVISPSGEVSDFTIINGVSPQINEEVIRVLQTTSGMWMPGYNNNKPVAMGKEISVAFKVNGSGYAPDFITLGRKHFSKGTEILFYKNNPQKALKFYDKGIMLLPNDENLLFMRGLARFEAGNTDGAYRDWDRINALGGTISFDEYHADEYYSYLKELKGYAELERIFNE